VGCPACSICTPLDLPNASSIIDFLDISTGLLSVPETFKPSSWPDYFYQPFPPRPSPLHHIHRLKQTQNSKPNIIQQHDIGTSLCQINVRRPVLTRAAVGKALLHWISPAKSNTLSVRDCLKPRLLETFCFR